MGRQISGQFGVAVAEATESGTYLLAKTTIVFNAAQMEGDSPPSGPSRRDWRCDWRVLSASRQPQGR